MKNREGLWTSGRRSPALWWEAGPGSGTALNWLNSWIQIRIKVSRIRNPGCNRYGTFLADLLSSLWELRWRRFRSSGSCWPVPPPPPLLRPPAPEDPVISLHKKPAVKTGAAPVGLIRSGRPPARNLSVAVGRFLQSTVQMLLTRGHHVGIN